MAKIVNYILFRLIYTDFLAMENQPVSNRQPDQAAMDPLDLW